jgi:glucose/arabinose dehydrogenase
MRTSALLATLLFLACSGEAGPPTTVAMKGDPAMKHYDIRFESLPAPFASPSAGNPPKVVKQPVNAQLHLPPGFHVSVFAEGLEDPRTMLLAPNGDLFVAEPGAGRIDVFRAGKRFTYASGLDEPFGLAFHAGYLYVGNTGDVIRYAYTTGDTAPRGAAQKIADLPPGGHSTRGLLFNRAGTKLYVSVGSASNVNPGEDPRRAAIVEYNPDGSGMHIFASGLRNPVGMAWEPVTGALWTAVNERDGLGDDLVPDYVTDVKSGAFYGWPYAWLGPHPEPRRREHPELVPKTIPPAVLIQAHSAALGIAFYNGKMFPAEYRGHLFVALHGSWNRKQRTGYKIIRVPMKNGRPTGGYDDFLTGFCPDPDSREVWGRPVGLLVMPDGSLLMSDDGGGKIWRVTFGPKKGGK